MTYLLQFLEGKLTITSYVTYHQHVLALHSQNHNYYCWSQSFTLSNQQKVQIRPLNSSHNFSHMLRMVLTSGGGGGACAFMSVTAVSW